MSSQRKGLEEIKPANRPSENCASGSTTRAPLRGLLRSHSQKKRGLRSGNFPRKIRVNEYFYQAYVNPVLTPPCPEDLISYKDWEEREAQLTSTTYSHEQGRLSTVCPPINASFCRTLKRSTGTFSSPATPEHDSLSHDTSVCVYSCQLFDDNVSSVANFWDACLIGRTLKNTNASKSQSNSDTESIHAPKKLALSLQNKRSGVPQKEGVEKRFTDVVDYVQEEGHLSCVMVRNETTGCVPDVDTAEESKGTQRISPIVRRPQPHKSLRFQSQGPHDPFPKVYTASQCSVDSCFKRLQGFSHAVQLFTHNVMQQYNPGAILQDRPDARQKKAKASLTGVSGSHEFLFMRHNVMLYETLFCSVDPLAWDSELYRCVAEDIVALVRLRSSSGGSLTVKDCWNHRRLVAYLIQKHKTLLHQRSVEEPCHLEQGVGVESMTPSVSTQLWERITRQLNGQSDGLAQYRPATSTSLHTSSALKRSCATLLRDAVHISAVRLHTNPRSSQCAVTTQNDVPHGACGTLASNGTQGSSFDTVKKPVDFHRLCQQLQSSLTQVCQVGMWKDAVRDMYRSASENDSRPLLETAIHLLRNGAELQGMCDLHQELEVLQHDVERCVKFQEMLMMEMPSIFEDVKSSEVLVEPATFSRLKELVNECEELPLAIPGRINLTKSIKDALTWQMMAAAAISGKDLDRCKDLLKEGCGGAVELCGIRELRSDVASGDWIESLARVLTTKKPITTAQLEYFLSSQSIALIETRFYNHPHVKELNARCEAASHWILQLRNASLYSLLVPADISDVTRFIDLVVCLFSLYSCVLLSGLHDKSDSYVKLFGETSKALVESLAGMKHTSPWCTQNNTQDANAVQLSGKETSGALVLKSTVDAKNQTDALDVLKCADFSMECLHLECPIVTYDGAAVPVSPEDLGDFCNRYAAFRVSLSAFTTIDAFRQKVKRWRKSQLCAVLGRGAVTEKEVMALIKEGYRLGLHVDVRHDVQDLVLVLHSYRLWVKRVDEMLKLVSRLTLQADIVRASHHAVYNTAIYKWEDVDSNHDEAQAEGDDETAISVVEDLLHLEVDRPSLDDITSLLVQHTECSILDEERGKRLHHIKETAERWRKRARELVKTPSKHPGVERARTQLLVEARYLCVSVSLEDQLKVDFFLNLWRRRVFSLCAPVPEAQVYDLQRLPVEKQFLHLLSASTRGVTKYGNTVAHGQESRDTTSPTCSSSFLQPHWLFIVTPEHDVIPWYQHLQDQFSVTELSKTAYRVLVQQCPEKDLLMVMFSIAQYWNRRVQEWCTCDPQPSHRYTVGEWKQLLEFVRSQPVSLVSAEKLLLDALHREQCLSLQLSELPPQLDMDVFERLACDVRQCPIRLPQWHTYHEVLKAIALLRKELTFKLQAPLDVSQVEEDLCACLKLATHTCAAFDVPLNPHSLTEYVELTDRLQKTTLWCSQYTCLDTVCWSLDEWKEFLDNAEHLHLTSNTLTQLHHKFFLSTHWMALYHLCATKHHCAVSPSKDSDQAKLPLVVAEFLVDVDVGLSKQFIFFQQLKHSVEALQSLKERSEERIEASQKQFLQCYFEKASLLPLASGGLSRNDAVETPYNTEESKEAFLSILRLTRELQKLCAEHNALPLVSIEDVKQQIRHEIKKRQLCLHLLLCSWSSVRLTHSTVSIPLTVAVQVLQDVKDWDASCEAYDMTHNTTSDTHFDIDALLCSIDPLPGEERRILKDAMEKVRHRLVRFPHTTLTLLKPQPIHASTDIIKLTETLHLSVQKSQHWIACFTQLVNNTQLENVCAHHQGDTSSDASFSWTLTLEAFCTQFFSHEERTTMLPDWSQLFDESTSTKYGRRSKNTSGFLASRKLSNHTRIADLFDGFHTQCAFTLGHVLDEHLIKRLDDFRRTYGIQSFRFTHHHVTHDTSLKPWASLVTPSLLQDMPQEKVYFLDVWKWRCTQTSLNVIKDNNIWKPLSTLHFPTIEAALVLLQNSESELYFQTPQLDIFYLSVGIVLVILLVVEHQFFRLYRPTSVVASDFVQPLPAYDSVLLPFTPSPFTACEAFEFIELLDLAVFQAPHKHHLITLVYDAFKHFLNTRRILSLLPVEDDVCHENHSACNPFPDVQYSWFLHAINDIFVKTFNKKINVLFQHSSPYVPLQHRVSALFTLHQKLAASTDIRSMYASCRHIVSLDLMKEHVPFLCCLCASHGSTTAAPPRDKRDPWIACAQCHRWFHSSCAGVSTLGLHALRTETVEFGTYTCPLCLLHGLSPETDMQVCSSVEEVSALVHSRWVWLWVRERGSETDAPQNTCSPDAQHESLLTHQSFPSLDVFLRHVYSTESLSFSPHNVNQRLQRSFHRVMLWYLEVCTLILSTLGGDDIDMLICHEENDQDEFLCAESAASYRGAWYGSAGSSTYADETIPRSKQMPSATSRPCPSKSDVSCVGRYSENGAYSNEILPKDKKRKSVHKAKGTPAPKCARLNIKDASWKKIVEDFQKRRPGVFSCASVPEATSLRTRNRPSENPQRDTFYLDLTKPRRVFNFLKEQVTLESVSRMCRCFLDTFLRHSFCNKAVTLADFMSWCDDGTLFIRGHQDGPDVPSSFHINPACCKQPWTVARLVLEGIFLGIRNIPLLSLMTTLFKRYTIVNKLIEGLVQSLQMSTPQKPLHPDELPYAEHYLKLIEDFRITKTHQLKEQEQNQRSHFLFTFSTNEALSQYFTTLSESCLTILSVLCFIAPTAQLGIARCFVVGTTPTATTWTLRTMLTPQHRANALNILTQAHVPAEILQLFTQACVLEDLHNKALIVMNPVKDDHEEQLNPTTTQDTTQVDARHNPGEILSFTEQQLDDLLLQLRLELTTWSEMWKTVLDSADWVCCTSLHLQHPSVCEPLSDNPTSPRGAATLDLPAHTDAHLRHAHKEGALLCVQRSQADNTPDTPCHYFDLLDRLQVEIECHHNVLEQARALYSALMTPFADHLPDKEREVLHALYPAPQTPNKLFSLVALAGVIQKIQKANLCYEHMDTLVTYNATQNALVCELNAARRKGTKRDAILLTQDEYARWIQTMEATICCWGETASWLTVRRERIERWIQKTRTLLKDFSMSPPVTYDSVLACLPYATSLKKELTSFIVDLSKTHLVSDLRRMIRELRSQKKALYPTACSPMTGNEPSNVYTTQTKASTKKVLKQNGPGSCVNETPTTPHSDSMSTPVAPCRNSNDATRDSPVKSGGLPMPSNTTAVPQSIFVLPLYASPKAPLKRNYAWLDTPPPFLQHLRLPDTPPSSLTLQTPRPPFTPLFQHTLPTTFTLGNTNAVAAANFYSGNNS